MPCPVVFNDPPLCIYLEQSTTFSYSGSVHREKMSLAMKTFGTVSGAIVLFILGFVLWYSVAADYGDSVTSGTYDLSRSGETSTLVLKPDHTFRQELNKLGKIEYATGTWRRIGQGGVVFSKEFLAISGQERRADGAADADINKRLGFLVSIALRQYYVLYYIRADPSPNHTTPGAYSRDEKGVKSSLVLKADHTFEQEVSNLGIAKQARGSWSVSQNGDIHFSRAFLKPSGESLSEDETASSLAPNDGGLQIAIEDTSGVPTFRKRQSPW